MEDYLVQVVHYFIHFLKVLKHYFDVRFNFKKVSNKIPIPAASNYAFYQVVTTTIAIIKSVIITRALQYFSI